MNKKIEIIRYVFLRCVLPMFSTNSFLFENCCHLATTAKSWQLHYQNAPMRCKDEWSDFAVKMCESCWNSSEIIYHSTGKVHYFVKAFTSYVKSFTSVLLVPWTLTAINKTNRFLHRFNVEGGAFFSRIVTVDKTGVHHYHPES